MQILLSGYAVLDLELHLSLWGRPTATVQLEADTPLELDARAALEFEEGTSYAITAVRVQPGIGWLRAALVGGAGRLEKPVQARFYEGVTAKTVIEDILADVGEQAGRINADALLTRWSRPEGTGIAALERVVQKAGRSWRVGRDGRVWVGVQDWPERSEPLVALEISPESRRAVFELTPDLTPGEAIEVIAAGESLPGLKLERVAHRAHGGQFRTEARWR